MITTSTFTITITNYHNVSSSSNRSAWELINSPASNAFRPAGIVAKSQEQRQQQPRWWSSSGKAFLAVCEPDTAAAACSGQLQWWCRCQQVSPARSRHVSAVRMLGAQSWRSMYRRDKELVWTVKDIKKDAVS